MHGQTLTKIEVFKISSSAFEMAGKYQGTLVMGKILSPLKIENAPRVQNRSLVFDDIDAPENLCHWIFWNMIQV